MHAPTKTSSPRPQRDCCRKNFFVPRTGKTDAEYAAAGIVLDTVFDSQMVAGVRKIADTDRTTTSVILSAHRNLRAITGIVQGWDRVNLPVITQLNAVQKFTYSEWFTGPPSTSPHQTRCSIGRWTHASAHRRLRHLTAGTSLLRVYVCDGTGYRTEQRR